MASTTYKCGVYDFTITYTYTDTKFTITGIKTKCKQSGWAAWELMPSLYFYILKGSSPTKKSWQTEYSGKKSKDHIAKYNGTYKNYHGNSPSAYLSNTAGKTVTWSAKAINGLSLPLSGSKVTITMGSFIINTTNTLSNVAYGYKTITLNLYKAPSNFKPTVYSKTDTTITVKATWTNGSQTSNAIFKLGETSKTITKSGSTATFTGLKGNTTYKITAYVADNKGSYGSTTLSATTSLSPVNSISIIDTTINSITVKASSSNTNANSLGYQYRYKLKSSSSYSGWSSTIAHGTSYTIKNLSPNNLYSIQARVASSLETNDTPYTIESWTVPQAALELKLLKGSEHNTIVATASSISSDSQIKYIFRLDSNAYNTSDYNKNLPNPREFTNLKGHSTHTISVKSKNMVSGLESAEVSKSIQTWYDPIYSLSTTLVNRWYWLLDIKAAFNYQGGPENIKSYQFSILADQNDYPYNIDMVLNKSKWNTTDNTYTISLKSFEIAANSISKIILSDNCTDEEKRSWENANIQILKKSGYSITLKASNGVPTINIPIYFKSNITEKSNVNSHKRGSEIPSASSNLEYNRDYNCTVKLIDNHDRSYTASVIYKTLDARIFYLINRTNNIYKDIGLSESVLIRPDNETIDIVTPNMINIIQPDGNIINMNQIINGDPREEYK